MVVIAYGLVICTLNIIINIEIEMGRVMNISKEKICIWRVGDDKRFIWNDKLFV